MPAGEFLADEVAKVLNVQIGKTVNEITAELPGKVTSRAVRYAVYLLLADGRAKTTGKVIPGLLGNKKRYKVLAVMQDAEPCHGPQDTTCISCGLGASA